MNYLPCDLDTEVFRLGRDDGVVIYEERVTVAWWVQLLVVVVVCVLAVVLVAGILTDNVFVAVWCGALAFLLVLALINFFYLRFRITEGTVVFGFGVFKKRFDRGAIEACRPHEIKVSNYLGVGIRLGWDGTIAYNTRGGPGIMMVVEGERRPYVVSVDHPEKICGILSPTGAEAR